MRIKIIFDNPAVVYFAGMTIVGHVQVINAEPISTRGVAIKFTGQGHTRWMTGSQENKITHTGSEEYYVGKVYLFGNGNETVSLSSGHHVYPFNFTLPQNIPSSFESDTGQVRHQCKAKINIPWGLDLTDIQPISVNHIYDLNSDENALRPVNRKEKKTFTFSSGCIFLTLMVDRTGFVPGEKLRVQCELDNDSDKTIQYVKMKLIKEVVFSSDDGSTRYDAVTIGKLRVEGITGRGKHIIWCNTGLVVPAVPASYLQHCNIIDIRYSLKVSVSPSGWTSNMDMVQPIIIGTIPLQQHFSLYQMASNMSAPGAPVNAAALTNNQPIDPAILRMSIPQPSAPPTSGVPEPTAPLYPSMPNAVPDNPPPYNPKWQNEFRTPTFPGFEKYPEMPPPTYAASQDSMPLEEAQHSNGVSQSPFIPSYVTFNPQDSRPGTPN